VPRQSFKIPPPPRSLFAVPLKTTFGLHQGSSFSLCPSSRNWLFVFLEFPMRDSVTPLPVGACEGGMPQDNDAFSSFFFPPSSSIRCFEFFRWLHCGPPIPSPDGLFFLSNTLLYACPLVRRCKRLHQLEAYFLLKVSSLVMVWRDQSLKVNGFLSGNRAFTDPF